MMGIDIGRDDIFFYGDEVVRVPDSNTAGFGIVNGFWGGNVDKFLSPQWDGTGMRENSLP